VLCHRDCWHAHVDAFDNVSLKIRERYLVKASCKQEASGYVRGETLKAEIEIARFSSCIMLLERITESIQLFPDKVLYL
jgi:hypothetical protein